MKSTFLIAAMLLMLSACDKHSEGAAGQTPPAQTTQAQHSDEPGHAHEHEETHDEVGHDDAGHDDHDDHDDHGDHGDHDDHGHGGEHAEAPKGPHGGRLFVEGDVQLELAIFEDGVPPEYRAWVTRANQPITPADANLQVTLTRLGGRVDQLDFKAVEIEGQRFLQSTSSVQEPHSFDVDIALTLGERRARFSVESYEGRTSIDPKVAKTAGITTAIVGPKAIENSRSFFGQITVDPNRVVQVHARFPGPVRKVLVADLASVRKGQTLAMVESNESLTSYAVTAPISGVLTQRRASIGALTGDEALFEITDFSEVFVQAQAFADDASVLRVGTAVRVSAGRASADATITQVLPLADQASGAVRFRVKLDNAEGQWRPGQTASLSLLASDQTFALAVDERALQRFRDWQVVFIQVGDTYEIRPLQLGRNDGRFVEVLGGLMAGDRYVVEQSFLIKADIEKSGASHDH